MKKKAFNKISTDIKKNVQKRDKIEITIEREERIKAISAMSQAILHLARALDNQVSVNVSNCIIDANKGPGINIDTFDPPTKTKLAAN